MLGGCSDAIGSDDETEANGTENGTGTENGADETDASADEPTTEPNASDGAEDEAVDNETDASDAESEAETAADDEADDRMSTEEFVTQLETVYSGEVAAYDEDDTHGSLTLVTEGETSSFELMNEMNGILTTYSTYVETGGAPSQQLAGEVDRTDGGQAVEEFRVETAWVEAYNRGDISEGELQDRVLETVET